MGSHRGDGEKDLGLRAISQVKLTSHGDYLAAAAAAAAKSLQSCLTLVTPWTAAYQAPPSMGFSRQKYWSGVPLPSLKCNFNLQINNFLPK